MCSVIKIKHQRYKDITGNRSGKVVAISYAYTHKRHAFWNCRCDCGKDFVTKGSAITRKNTKSCGCVRKEYAKSGKARLRHGMSKHPIHMTWRSLKVRTSFKYQQKYPFYAGVKLCKEWETFEGFLANPPHGRPFEPGLVLGRIKDVGDYTPTNCRFITKSENSKEQIEKRRHLKSLHLNKSKG